MRGVELSARSLRMTELSVPIAAPCPTCSSNHHEVVLAARAGSLPLVACADCGLVRLGAVDTPDDLYSYYDRRRGASRDALYDPLTTARLRLALRDLERLAPGRRLLDVGCGEGQLVDVALAAGWDARGIDLAGGAIDICRSFGLPCDRKDVFSDEFEPAAFDVVTMVELIEHVSEPAQFLRRAEELLVPGGVLYVTTPNWSSLGRRLLGERWSAVSIEHLTYFTPKTFRRVVRASTDLDIVSLQTRNISAAALRRLDPRLWGVRRERSHRVTTSPEPERMLRQRIDASPALRLTKSVANGLLAATGLGEAMFVILRRPDV